MTACGALQFALLYLMFFALSAPVVWILTGIAEFTLGMVIQYAHLLDVHDMEFIYENTLPNAPLRLFANRWVRWDDRAIALGAA